MDSELKARVIYLEGELNKTARELSRVTDQFRMLSGACCDLAEIVEDLIGPARMSADETVRLRRKAKDARIDIEDVVSKEIAVMTPPNLRLLKMCERSEPVDTGDEPRQSEWMHDAHE